jgi:hypothetical protein
VHVQDREGYSKSQKKLMLLSPETLLGLRITGKCKAMYEHNKPNIAHAAVAKGAF